MADYLIGVSAEMRTTEAPHGWGAIGRDSLVRSVKCTACFKTPCSAQARSQDFSKLGGGTDTEKRAPPWAESISEGIPPLIT